MVDASRRADAPPPGIQYERHGGAASAPLAARYRRREPEKTVLYAIVRDHLETFLEEARERDGCGYPAFIEREFRRRVGGNPILWSARALPAGFYFMRVEDASGRPIARARAIASR